MSQEESRNIKKGDSESQFFEGNFSGNIVEGGTLKEEKSELQKIIDRNKSQLKESAREEEVIETDFSKEGNLPESQNLFNGQAQEKVAEIEKIAEKNKELMENLDRKITREKNVAEKSVEAMVPETKKEEILENLEKELKEEGVLSSGNDGDDNVVSVKEHAQSVLEINDPQRQIDRLVQLAINRDPGFAIKVAQHLDNNYILDQVHDQLVEDKVRDELIKKGLLKEI